MCPDDPRPGRQQGFLLPVAAFILVVIGGFALTLSRTTSQTAIAVPQEVLSVNAFYAADSAAQYALNQLFYSTAAAVTRASADTGCNSVDGAGLTFAPAALSNCTVALSCAIANDAGDTTSFYTVISAASCSVGANVAERSVQVSAFMQ